MAKYRNRLEIIVGILNAAGPGVKKTAIMYTANLSYQLLEKYLDETTKMGLIHLGINGYETTDKGKTFLEKYNDFSSKYSKIEGELQRLLFERESLERLCEPVKNTSSRLNSRRNRRT